ncbi:MAG: hypothetical protein MZV70_56650 [Desulfobacterales bacterium]|nr:hypothetical protein [Desulfobacterales bacterium]
MITFDDYIVELFEQGPDQRGDGEGLRLQPRDRSAAASTSVKSARGQTTTDIGKLEIDKAYNQMI